MKLDPDFGQFLALALAIHRRDEVAVTQFFKQISSQIVNQFEEDEHNSSRVRRGPKADEELEIMMAEYMKTLSGLTDPAGMDWLRSQLKA